MNSSLDETVIPTSDLVVRHNRNEVLYRISLFLSCGPVTGLLGPSGCEEIILMRIPMGVQHIIAGPAVLLGLPAGHLRLY